MARPFVRIIDKDRGWGALKSELATAHGGVYGKAGVIGEKAAEQHPGENGESLNNAELALIHEFGLGVPERSFIRAAFDGNVEKYSDHLRQFVAAVYDRKLSIERMLGLLAQEVASDIRKLILEGDGVPPPNAHATIEQKGSSRPLVASGQMKNAITGAVVHGKPEE